jgi:DNA mismatch repair protein MutL
MGRIRVLPDTVANKIAAGEVVERPASVVKELLENSLDAGGGRFRVEIESGGRRLIRVSDDGCGMLRDDAMLAFERHATSKLRDVKDLLSIATLGFRGEALPSIASVSRLLLETRSREEETGARVEVAGGKMLRVEEAALAPGTVIAVRDLFYNVPARKKFLRSEQTELAHIASLVTHYSLARPEASFELLSGGGELLHVTTAASLRERVFQIFGSETLDELVDLGDVVRELREPAGPDPEEVPVKVFRLRGFVSRPQVQKNNRNSIFIFVNGRLIRDRVILHALSAAYYNLMPPACFPFALLFLECASEEVDVNVHPSKTEVRFRHQSFVHDFTRDTLRGKLIESRPAPAFAVNPAPAQGAARLPFSEFSQMIDNAAGADAPSVEPRDAAAAPAAAPPADRESDLPVVTLRPPPGPAPRLSFGEGSIPLAEPAPAAQTVKLAVPDTHIAFPAELMAAPASLSSLADLRPLGQIHNSFIVAAGRDGLWIIDQHVAHERILFEKVLKQRAAGQVEMQQLLMPLVIPLTAAQQIEYARIADELQTTGFETEPFGNRTLAVKAAPAGIGPGDVERLLYEILEIAEDDFRGLSFEDVRRSIAASIACRAAIKINTRLDQTRMEWLLSALAATDCPMACPHGRPIALQYTTREILKAFHRV